MGDNLSSSQFSPFRIYAAGTLVCGALAFGAYYFGVEPAMARQSAEQARQQQLTDLQQEASTLTGSTEQSRRRLAGARKAMADLPLHLEPAANINHRIAQLTDLAGDVALTVNEIKPGNAKAGKDYQSVPIIISGQGSYPACAAFLHRLQRDLPDMAVESFLTRATDATGMSEFRFELTWHTTVGN